MSGGRGGTGDGAERANLLVPPLAYRLRSLLMANEEPEWVVGDRGGARTKTPTPWVALYTEGN